MQYEFTCKKCGHTFIKVYHFHEATPSCPKIVAKFPCGLSTERKPARVVTSSKREDYYI